jgi:hydrogenase nickel incorporation protein HypA/HybF
MHEMSLAEGILRIIEDQTAKGGIARVLRVRLEVGRLAGVECEALRFAFDVVMRGSLAEGAELEILEPPGLGWCLDCAATVPVDALYDPCPQCGGFHVQPSGGRELRVLDLEIEPAAGAAP